MATEEGESLFQNEKLKIKYSRSRKFYSERIGLFANGSVFFFRVSPLNFCTLLRRACVRCL